MFNPLPLIIILSSITVLIASSIIGKSQIIYIQVSSIFLVVLLVLLTFGLRKKNSHLSQFLKTVTVFISSFFVQFFVISTGGFFSLYLVFIHLYAISLGFSLDMVTSITFLFSSVITLSLIVLFNSFLLTLYVQDIGSVALYLTSFIGVIPASMYITQTYHFKDKISSLLSQHLKIRMGREEEILKGLDEFVIVTDRNLNILTINFLAEKTFNVTSREIIGKPFFDLIKLVDEQGSPADVNSLSINRAISAKCAYIIKGFYLHAQKKYKVVVQARPILDSEGQVNQLVFIIGDTKEYPASGAFSNRYQDAQFKLKNIAINLKQNLLKSGQIQLRNQFELFDIIGQDLLFSRELLDNQIKKQTYLQDLYQLCQQIITEKLNFAQGMQVNLKLELVNEMPKTIKATDEAAFSSPVLNLPRTVSKYIVPIDSKLVKVLIQKLIDLSVLVVSGQNQSTVELALKVKEDTGVELGILIWPVKILPYSTKGDFFEEYYKQLEKNTNLNLGSGLEYNLIKSISEQLNIPVTTTLLPFPPQLLFQISFRKDVKNS